MNLDRVEHYEVLAVSLLERARSSSSAELPGVKDRMRQLIGEAMGERFEGLKGKSLAELVEVKGLYQAAVELGVSPEILRRWLKRMKKR